MKFWSERENKFIYIDESLITRSHVKVPNQYEPVPIQSMKPDIINSFTEAIMAEKDISEETKAQIERRCGKERRYFYPYDALGDKKKGRRKHDDRRGRKSAEDLRDFLQGYLDNIIKRHEQISQDDDGFVYCDLLSNAIVQFLNY